MRDIALGKKTLIFAIGLLTHLPAAVLYSQYITTPAQAKIRITGIVRDLNTFLPISNVTVSSNTYLTRTDDNGNFRMLITPTDTIEFSHVGYESTLLPYEAIKQGEILTVTLTWDINMLKPITIYDFDSEYVFKGKVLSVNEVSEDLEILRANQKAMTGLGQHAPIGPMGAAENYSAYIKGPQDAKLLSTNMRVGLLSLFKKSTKQK